MKKSVFLVLLMLSNYAAHAQVVWPLANLPDNDLRNDISSPYGPRVINNGNYDFHHALDIVATVNNVYSVDNGTVVKTGQVGVLKYVIIAYSYQNNPQHVPYYVRYYGLSERDVDKDSTVNQGELIGKYSYAYAHLDMKYYPDFGNSPHPVYQSSDNTQNPLALLPYNNNAATQRVTFSNISWVQDDPNDPSKDYVSVTVVDDGLDLNDITVFITANDELGGPLDQGDILYGVNTPYNEINYDTRRNCSNDQHYANGYGNNTSLENSFAGTGGVLIIPANYNHWTGGKKVEFRFLLNPAQARHIQNNKMWVGVKATDLKATQYTQNWVSVNPTPIGGGGPSGVPTNVTATPYAANMSVNLSWQSGANTEFFSVYRHLTAESDSAYQLIGITQDPSFEDTYKTIPGASYTYSIVGDNGGEEGPASAEVTATMPASGTVSSDRVWLGADLTGNVTINNDAELRIQQGATLTFTSGTSLTSNGVLCAIGTASQPITFTGSNWGSIVLSGSGADGSTLKYVNIQNNFYLSVDNTSNITIQNGTFTNSTGDAIDFYESSGSIMNTTITNPGADGIWISNSSGVDCKGNTITKTGGGLHTGTGIYYYQGSNGNVIRNDISGFNWGLASVRWSSVGSDDSYYHYRNNRIRNCNVGLLVGWGSDLYFGDPPPSDFMWNSIYDNTWNAKVGVSWPWPYQSGLAAYGDWWGSAPPPGVLPDRVLPDHLPSF